MEGISKIDFFDLITQEGRKNVEIFIKEMNEKPLPDWDNPSDEDWQNVSSAIGYIENFDGNALKAAQTLKEAHERASKCASEFCFNRMKEDGVNGTGYTVEYFGGDISAYVSFKRAFLQEAENIYKQVFSAHFPMNEGERYTRLQ